MRTQFHCSYCDSVFNNEDACRKHEIEKHAQGKAPKEDWGGVDIRTYENKRREYEDTIETLIEAIAKQGCTLVHVRLYPGAVERIMTEDYPFTSLKPELRDRILRRFHAMLNEEG